MQVSRSTTLQEIRGAAAIDRIFFGNYCFPQDFYIGKNSPYHYKLNDMLNGTDKYNALEAHREWSKSTFLSFVDPVHQAAYAEQGEYKFLSIICESQSQAINHLHRCRDGIRYSKNYRRLYGDLYAGATRWGATDVILGNGTRIVALGTRQKVRGLIHMHSRPTRTYLDDIESEENAGTPLLRRKNRDWFFGSVVPYVSRDGQLFVLQTPIAHDCIIHRLIKDPLWNTLKVPLYFVDKNTGEKILTWKESWPWKRINALRNMYASQGEMHIFDREYLLIPVSGVAEGVKREDFRYYNGDFVTDDYGITYIRNFVETDMNGIAYSEPEDLVINVFTACDPALGIEKKHCRTSILTIGMDQYGRVFVLNPVTFREKNTKKIGYTFAEMSHDYKAEAIGIETILFQQCIAEHVKDWEEENGIHFSIKGFKPKKSKDYRGEWTMGRVKAHKVFVRPQHEDFIEEFISWPDGDLKDQIDTMYMALKISFRPKPGTVVDLLKQAEKSSRHTSLPPSHMVA